MDFLLDIYVPDNIFQMVAWYTLLVACVVLFIVFKHKKRGKKRTIQLQEKINAIEEYKAQLMNEKAMTKKDLFAQMLSIGAISSYCKQTFETSQFVVYDEASKLLDSAQSISKNIDVKKWKEDETNHNKTLIIENLDGAIMYLSQAL